MKTIVIAMLLALATGGLAQDGENITGITGAGVKLGVAWASMNTNDDEFNAGSAGGLTGGAFLTYGLAPKLAIQPELLYVAKGSSEADLFGSSGFDCGYLELPVLLKYNLYDKGRMKPGLYLGPAVSALLFADLFSEGFINDYSYDVKDGMKSFDASFVVGGEVEFGSSKQVKFSIDVRYSLGLTNTVDPTKWNEGRKIVDEGDWGPFHWIDYDRPLLEDNVYAKNRVFSIMMGVRFM